MTPSYTLAQPLSEAQRVSASCQVGELFLLAAWSKQGRISGLLSFLGGREQKPHPP